MSLIDNWVFRTRVEAMLDPGERLLIVITVYDTDFGSTLNFRREATGDTSRHPLNQRWILGFSLFGGGILLNDARIGLAWCKSSGHGAPGTIGHRLWHLLDPFEAARWSRRPPELGPRPRSGNSFILAVTDRRVWLLTDSEAIEDQGLVVVEELAPDRVVSARHRGALFCGGRLEVRFADTSMKAFRTAFLVGVYARRAATALNSLATRGTAA